MLSAATAIIAGGLAGTVAATNFLSEFGGDTDSTGSGVTGGTFYGLTGSSAAGYILTAPAGVYTQNGKIVTLQQSFQLGATFGGLGVASLTLPGAALASYGLGNASLATIGSNMNVNLSLTNQGFTGVFCALTPSIVNNSLSFLFNYENTVPANSGNTFVVVFNGSYNITYITQ